MTIYFMIATLFLIIKTFYHNANSNLAIWLYRYISVMTFFLVIASHNVVLFFKIANLCLTIVTLFLIWNFNFLCFILRCKQAAIFDQYFPLMSVYCNLLLSALYFSSGTYIGQMEYERAMNWDVFMLSCFVTYQTNVFTGGFASIRERK